MGNLSKKTPLKDSTLAKGSITSHVLLRTFSIKWWRQRTFAFFWTIIRRRSSSPKKPSKLFDFNINALFGLSESENFVTLDEIIAIGIILLGMPINFSAFAITEGNETTSADGTISIEVNSLNPPVTTITIATSTFVTTSEGSEEFLTNFSVTITEDASMFPVAVTVETSFTFSSPRIGGEVTVTTSLTLESMGENYPLFGEPRIEGANQAVIVMIALDANTVRLEVDIDGDGAVDETLDMTWDELMAAA